MIQALAGLLLCQIAGEALSRLTHMPVPGPVLGLLVLLLYLLFRGSVPEALESTSRSLLGNLSLLFVPAGTGIILHLHRVQEQWLPLGVAVAGSTVISITVGALVFQALHRPHSPPGETAGAPPETSGQTTPTPPAGGDSAR